MSNGIQCDSNEYKNIFWHRLPSRETVVKTGSALAAFTGVAIGIIGIISIFYSDEASPSCNHCLSSTAPQSVASVVNATLGTLAIAANGAFTNKFKLEEFESCRPALQKAKDSLWVCEAEEPKRNRTQTIRLPQDRGLASNLELAESILFDTLAAIRFSPNNLERSRKLINERAKKQGIEISDLSQFTNSECLELSRWVANYEAAKQEGSLFTLYRINAELAESTSIGNCGEMAAVALFKGMKRGIWNVHLDYAKVQNGDHGVVIIGRDPQADPTDYRTWGASAVVIDPWAEKFYPLSSIEENYKDYGINPQTGEPILKAFNPLTDQLSISIGNVCSKEKLLKLNLKKFLKFLPSKSVFYDQIITKIEQFHENVDLETKTIKAKELSHLCDQFSDELHKFCDHFSLICEDDKISDDFLTISLLKDQMDYFVELYVR